MLQWPVARSTLIRSKPTKLSVLAAWAFQNGRPDFMIAGGGGMRESALPADFQNVAKLRHLLTKMRNR
jgi:hypothetical protein